VQQSPIPRRQVTRDPLCPRLSAGTAAATYYGGSNAFYPNAIENSTTDDGYSRWGDYVDIQPDAYFPNAFAVAGYATTKNSKNQVQYDPTYTQMIP
jgi:hypothetical protein